MESFSIADGYAQGGAGELMDDVKDWASKNATVLLGILIVIVIISIWYWSMGYVISKPSERLANPTSTQKYIALDWGLGGAGAAEHAATPTAAQIAANPALASYFMQNQASQSPNFLAPATSSAYVLSAPEFDCANRQNPASFDEWAWMTQQVQLPANASVTAVAQGAAPTVAATASENLCAKGSSNMACSPNRLTQVLMGY